MAMPSRGYIVDRDSFPFLDIELIPLKQAILPKDLPLGHPDSTLPRVQIISRLILLAKAIDISYAEEPASVPPFSIHVH